VGLLNPVMAPMIPFIIAGNAILVIAFAGLNRINYWLGSLTGCVLKAAFLYGMSYVVAGMLNNNQLAQEAVATMGWVQLITAIGGSVVAYGLITLVRIYHKI
jgi:hypothetical protein